MKSLKPLVNFRFYLDIEKHNVSLKIESKIKELGGVSFELYFLLFIFFIFCALPVDSFAALSVVPRATLAVPSNDCAVLLAAMVPRPRPGRRVYLFDFRWAAERR